MSFSEFLESRRSAARALAAQLRQRYAYVSVLGADITARSVRVDRNTSGINPGRDTECGFVVKLSNGGAFFEYSLDDIAGDPAVLAAQIADAFALEKELLALGYCTLYALITAENEVSCAFHRAMGYHLCATLPASGFKHGRWLDVYWYEKSLRDKPAQPQPVRRFAGHDGK